MSHHHLHLALSSFEKEQILLPKTDQKLPQWWKSTDEKIKSERVNFSWPCWKGTAESSF